MNIENKIIDFLENTATRALSSEEIVAALNLENEDIVTALRTLRELEEKGILIQNKRGKYNSSKRKGLVIGTISINSKGFGFVTPLEAQEGKNKDIFVPHDSLNEAMNNDIVLLKVHAPVDDTHSAEGIVIKIIEHANKKIVGTIEEKYATYFVVPDDPKITKYVFLKKKEVQKLCVGMKVVVEVVDWEKTRKKKLQGTIVEVIGKTGDPGVDILSIMHQYDLPFGFPGNVYHEAELLPDKIPPQAYEDRVDRRDYNIVTIDGEDAKDLDDGVFAKKLANGNYFLGVYIADVSYYVRENSQLDLEARRRGTSVYLVDRVIPMLPKRISNGICSLNAGEDRLSLAAEMEIDKTGQVVKYDILPTVISVKRRLSYNIANQILIEKLPEVRTEYSDVVPLLETLAELRDILKEKRRKRGSIDFNIPELKVKLDDKGRPLAIVKRIGSLSESIIEECMLVANETVSEHMSRRQLPFIYRIHEQPDSEKIADLNNFLGNFSMHISADVETEKIHPSTIQKLLRDVTGTPLEKIVMPLALRSMQQARYSEENKHHFGLAATYYTHFTSPIRRYPDLIVHRLLRETMGKKKLSAKRTALLEKMLPEIALSSSMSERTAANAERETVELKKVEYMQQFIGKEFPAVITNITSFGIFVEIPNGVEGLIHISTLSDDYYSFVADEYMLVGEHSGHTYRMGDPIQVKLVNADMHSRAIDFLDVNNMQETMFGLSPALSLTDTLNTQPEKKHGKGKGKKPAHKKGKRHSKHEAKRKKRKNK